jgi:Dockerin type I domain
MLRIRTATIASILTLLALVVGPAPAQDAVELLGWTDIRGGAEFNYHGAHAIEGTTSYHIVRDVEGVVTPNWGSQIVRVDNFTTSPSNTVLVTDGQWKATTGIDPVSGSILPSTVFGIVGDWLLFGDIVTDSIWRVNKTTGIFDAYVAENQIMNYTEEDDANLIDASAINAAGEMAFYDQDSDSILLTDGPGQMTTLVTMAEYTTLTGSTPTNFVSGGMAFDADGDLFWTRDEKAIYRRDVSTGDLSVVLTQAEIQTVTTDSEAGGSPFNTSVEFNDVHIGEDGWFYFYDRAGFAGAAQGILRFDPDAETPLDTLEYFVTEADLTTLMGTHYVSDLSWYEGGIAWSQGLHKPEGCGLYWKEAPVDLAGDANGDGAVTDADYTIWADNYGATEATPEMGDFNGDGSVTDADYTIWADNYGAGTGAIPEPVTLVLLACGAVFAARRR